MADNTTEPAAKAEGKKKAAPKAEVEWTPRPRPNRDPPALKYTRKREVMGSRPGKTRFVVEAFLVPGPRAAEYERSTGNKFICPSRPGGEQVPPGGRWYPVTTYLLRQVRDGSLAEGKPGRDELNDIKLPAEGKE